MVPDEVIPVEIQAKVLQFASKEEMHAYARAEQIAYQQGRLAQFTMSRAIVHGGKVQPWVQALADQVVRRWPNVGTIGTYPGHDPSLELALDIFPRNKAQGDEIAEWATQDSVIDQFSIWYHIWWQRIWNRLRARRWRDMEDRGSDTKNHKDHLHFSCNSTGSVDPEEDDMTKEERETLAWAKDMIKKMTAGFADDDYEAAERLNAAVKANQSDGGGDLTLEEVRADIVNRLKS